MVLPVDIDTTYADDGSDASVKLHQQHHDEIHTRLNAIATFHAPAPSGTASIDTAALQALINSAAALGGGEVHLQVGGYKLDATLTILNCSNVKLVGAGAFHDIYGGFSSPTGTVLAWHGSSGGTVLSVGGTNAMTSYNRDLVVKDLAIDCRSLAGRGLLVTSSWWGTYQNLHIRNATICNLDILTVTDDIADVAQDTQGCLFDKISIRAVDGSGTGDTGIGVRLGSGTVGLGNTCLNNFYDLHIYHINGIGLRLGDCDTNRFYGIWTTGGTAYGIELHGGNVANKGHARANQFFGVQAASGIMTRTTGYTTLPNRNYMFGLSRENSAPLPVSEDAAHLAYITDEGETLGIYNNQNRLASGEDVMDRRWANSSSAAMGSGNLKLTYFTAEKSETITQVRILSGATAAGTPTLFRIGIYSVASNGDLTLVASTANDTTICDSTFTTYTKSLSASWKKTAGRRYAVGILSVATTAPTTYGYQSASGVQDQSPRLTGSVPSQTDLPSSVTSASITNANNASHAHYAVLLP
jgi:hypothetical protein